MPKSDALTGKFTNCAGRALPPAQVKELQQELLSLDEASSLRTVVAAIATPGEHRERQTG